ncbi:MAG: carbohydrate kinase family protein [Clostridia bacterium]|nr:carbohydrate kinase family protein [Clostridia bacterium]
MMKNKICIAGNIVLDLLYSISGYPVPGKLTTITDIGKTVGGSVPNVGIDIKRLMPDVTVAGVGLVGADENGDYILDRLTEEGIDISAISRHGATSFTAVMSDNFTRERTFFQFRGANSDFCEDSFRWEDVDCDILHIAYILLLDALDEEDDEYGTKMARLLAHARERGIKTSIDVVSESGERFMKLVPPALKYTDYCIINEIEAGESTGIALRDDNGALIYDNLPKALSALFGLGVGEWAVIHCPEGGFGMDKEGNLYSCGQINLPKDKILGKVGAGDAFCAGVLCAAHRGMDLGKALLLANCAATMSLTEPGATEAMGTIEEAFRYADIYGVSDSGAAF